MDIRNSVALVTGANRGIGRQLVRALLDAGASKVYACARDLGEKEDYRTAKMPPVNTGLLDGQLGWRQHDGGHEDRTNIKHFIEWASRMLARKNERP